MSKGDAGRTDQAAKEYVAVVGSQDLELMRPAGAVFSPPRALSVEVLRDLGGIAALGPDYARLEVLTCNTLPFCLFEWHLTWCRHFLRHDAAIRDEPLFHVVRNPEGLCVAIVPLVLTRRRVAGVQFRSINLLGADPALTEIRSCLIQPGFDDSVAEAVNRSLDRDRDWDCIHWIGRADRFTAAIAGLRRLEWRPAPPGYVLDLPATWEAFRAGLKRNIRESLRHCCNSLKRDGHSFEFHVIGARDEVDDALARLFELHAKRAAMPAGVVHPDHFASAGARSFVLDVCRALAERGVLRIFQLRIAGRVVATRVGFIVGGSLYLYYSGFDPLWSKYSVMTTTVAEAIKYAISQGLTTINLSPGTDVSKTRWGPREVAYRTAYETGPRLMSRMVSHAYVRAKSATGMQGWLLTRFLPGRRHWH